MYKPDFMKQLIILFLALVFFLSCEKDNLQPAAIKACFTYQLGETNPKEVYFLNCSEYATSYIWDFGDGTNSTEEEPIHIYEGYFPFYVKLIVYNESGSDSVFIEVTNQILDKKPNIYIYPLIEMDLKVRISFPEGGEVVKSLPDYNSGWDIHVDTDGKINSEYNYLFYESKHPDGYQYNEGWCIRRSELKSFFESNMNRYNFSQQEIKDFTDYWIPLLKEFNFYAIYPQSSEIINKTVQLDFSVFPDNINRLYYGVVGKDEHLEIEKPDITPFSRTGFCVVEWGVFTK